MRLSLPTLLSVLALAASAPAASADSSATTLNPHGSRDHAVASCPAGMRVIGGYVTANGAGVEQSTHLGGPDGPENDARLGYVNNTSATVNDTFTVSAICAHVTYANLRP